MGTWEIYFVVLWVDVTLAFQMYFISSSKSSETSFKKIVYREYEANFQKEKPQSRTSGKPETYFLFVKVKLYG